MLPAPKLAAPVKEAPERVLGGGKGPGLVFHEPRSQRAWDTPVIPSNDDVAAAEQETEEAHLPFIPVSVKKGKANISLEESSERVTLKTQDPPPPTTVDLFSLSTSRHIGVLFSTKRYDRRLRKTTCLLCYYFNGTSKLFEHILRSQN